MFHFYGRTGTRFFLINYHGAEKILTGASSHNAATERQFRYPTEYGGQNPLAQWTVTGAGVALLAVNENQLNLPFTTSATIGKVIDMGLSDPFNMGGAMAPAAADTILAHFKDRRYRPFLLRSNCDWRFSENRPRNSVGIIRE